MTVLFRPIQSDSHGAIKLNFCSLWLDMRWGWGTFGGFRIFVTRMAAERFWYLISFVSFFVVFPFSSLKWRLDSFAPRVPSKHSMEYLSSKGWGTQWSWSRFWLDVTTMLSLRIHCATWSTRSSPSAPTSYPGQAVKTSGTMQNAWMLIASTIVKMQLLWSQWTGLCFTKTSVRLIVN